MKPEKVKSRWRRTSELETGEKATVSMAIEVKQPMSVNEKMDVSQTKSNSEKEPVSTEDMKKKLPQYGAINENLYLFERKRTKRKKETRRILCECSLSDEDRRNGVLGCQEECLNRLLMIECGSRCPTGEYCSNKRFQKCLYAKVEPFVTEKKGWGLRLLEDVPMDNFVIEYVGEVLNRQEFKQRVKQYAREKSNHYYFMLLKSDEILDASNKGNLSRFMNHSCDPNCVTQKWTVNGELRIGFFAKRDLKAGEELTFDYKFQRYGREAQKCFCGQKICTGYIGVSKKALDFNTNKSNTKRKRNNEDKKQENLEDLILEEEIEKLTETKGLRNKEETLLLARLMVRAEDTHSREKLLDILLGTMEIGFFRLFLDYHGLLLLWSWMTDVTESKLKTKILRVLSLLPIPNKTMLIDSKVYSLVEKWATMQSSLVPCGDSEQPFSIACDKTSKKAYDTSDSDTPIASDLEENCTTNGNAEISCTSNEESGDNPDEENNVNNEEIASLANNLMTNWKELKEVFRIPRREPTKQYSKNQFYRNDRRTQNFCKKCRYNNESYCPHFKKFSQRRETWNYQGNFNNYKSENFYRNENFESENFPRRTLLQNPPFPANYVPPILSKEERREQFARQAEQQYRRKSYNQELVNSDDPDYYNYTDSNCTLNDSNSSFSKPKDDTNYEAYYFNQNITTVNQLAVLPNLPIQDNSSMQTHTVSVNRSVYEQNVTYHSTHSQVPFMGKPLETISHQTPPVIPDINHIISSLTGMGNLTSPPVVPVAPMHKETVVPPVVMHPPLYTPEQNFSSDSISQEHYSESPVKSQYISNQDQFLNGQNDAFYTDSQCSTQQLPVQTSIVQPFSYTESNGALPTKVSPTKLPANWRTATDTDGNTYYYHAITRQTQWDPPEHEQNEEPDEDTPIYDEPKERKHAKKKHSHRSQKKPRKRSTTTAAADTSSAKVTHEVAKKIKELFRTKMSSFVIQCLNPYRRDDCRVGKITSNDDFKYLARKLTHFVMQKELKHCKIVGDLECNDNVKYKARDYIHKYMARHGPYYAKEKNES